jgi:hypothetical protein
MCALLQCAAFGWVPTQATRPTWAWQTCAWQGALLAVQLLLCRTRLSQAQDAGVVPLSRPQGVSGCDGGADRDDAGRRDRGPRAEAFKAFWCEPSHRFALAQVVAKQRVYRLPYGTISGRRGPLQECQDLILWRQLRRTGRQIRRESFHRQIWARQQSAPRRRAARSWNSGQCYPMTPMLRRPHEGGHTGSLEVCHSKAKRLAMVHGSGNL